MTDSHPPSCTPPIACSLGLKDLRDRAKAWAAIGRKHLVKRERHAAGVILHYRAGAEAVAALRRLVALEHECCSSLTFGFVEQQDNVVLTVIGPPEAAPIIQECWGVGTADRTAPEKRNP